ncbi:similar to glucosamine-6-phosphate isomerase protein NagB, N-terminal part [Listeria monocytogenes SLCC2378]|nr:similar to glucosamine-6-phosphate isomerase protein NagB, N-terminal part [Listeria monocytogenes SLCC2378]
MQLITTENKLAGSKKALEIIEKGITSGEVNTLGLATGSTPETLYAELVKSDVDTKNVTTTNLDEYVGLAANDPNSYHYYMNELLFSKKHLKKVSYLTEKRRMQKQNAHVMKKFYLSTQLIFKCLELEQTAILVLTNQELLLIR